MAMLMAIAVLIITVVVAAIKVIKSDNYNNKLIHAMKVT